MNIKKKDVFQAFLSLENDKPLLKFLTCGSVDDGKSTLIGRLLHDTKKIYDDQLCSLKNDSKHYGIKNSKIDLALLVDGLQDEREQGITIDVAYRYFSTNYRKFIIVDTPGHEQYTRNMVTGASTCHLSIVLVDIKKGLSKQTYRHSFISSLLGIKNVVVAVNKMDLVDYREDIYTDLKNAFITFSKKITKNLNINFIPISALLGDNIVSTSKFMNWYQGPTLLRFLETVNIINYSNSKDIRFPVQYINRPNADFRGYSGMLVSGKIYVNQDVKILPSNINSCISRIVTFKKDKKYAQVGEAVTIVLKDELDISRGDFIVDINSDLHPFQKAIIDIVWMNDEELLISQSYNIKLSGKKTCIYIRDILYKIDIYTLEKRKTSKLLLNEIGRIIIEFHEPMIFDSYKKNRFTGNLIFIDRFTNNTVGAGMIKSGVKKEFTTYLKNIQEFELDLKNLIYRYFPHRDITKKNNQKV